MPRFKEVAGVGKVQLTSEEEKVRDAEEAEAQKKQEEYLKVKYKDDRQLEYPSIQELIVALYDADDKAGIDKKRAEIKRKYPKPE
mgnify:CR=1 FL=1|tara:strand:- start:36 stop:290 length:255 start_codon:yes stop_codon:yes gene_type:complete